MAQWLGYHQDTWRYLPQGDELTMDLTGVEYGFTANDETWPQ